jgi:MFS family permease
LASRVFGGAASALRNAQYRRYWAGHFLASIGRWMYRMSIGWLAWELTGSTVWLGVVAFVDLFPSAILTVFAGALSDRVGSMRIIRVSIMLTALLAGLLGVLTITNLVTIELLILIAFLKGCADSLGQPARLSIINALVPKRDLSSAIALGSTSFNASRIIGPAIAGGLIAYTGTGSVMILCAVAFLYFYSVVARIVIEERPKALEGASGILADIWAAFLYVMRHPGIRFVMILLTATSLLIRPVIDLLPSVVDRVYDTGPKGMSIILGAIGVGAVIASLWLARRGRTAGLTNLLVVSTVLMAAPLAISMLFVNIWLAAIFFAVLGFFLLAGNVSAQTLIQNSVDPDLRGRVMALYIVFGHALPAVGVLFQGWAANYVGLQPAIAGGAFLMLIVAGWALMLRRGVIQQLEDTKPTSAQ